MVVFVVYNSLLAVCILGPKYTQNKDNGNNTTATGKHKL